VSMIGCAAVQERAPDLALGILDGSERAEAVEHVSHCTRCQATVSEFAEVADLLPALAPEAEPPPGFERRVLAAMRADRRRTFLRRVATAAVAAALAAILSIVIVRVVDADRDTRPQAAAPVLRSVQMISDDEVAVGRVAVSGTGRAAVAVSVDYHVPDGRYTLQVQHAGEVTRSIGTIAIVGGHGEWRGDTRVPADAVTVAMTDGTGGVVCQAALPPAPTSVS
jgi:anti-sigma-K factor RskA